MCDSHLGPCLQGPHTPKSTTRGIEVLLSRHKRPQTHLGRCGRLGTVLGRLCGCLDTAPPPHPPASLHLASATAAAFRSASSPEAATDDRLPHHAQEHLKAGSQSPFAAILVASFSLGAARTASVILDLRAKQGQQKRRALRNGARCRGRWCATVRYVALGIAFKEFAGDFDLDSL